MREPGPAERAFKEQAPEIRAQINGDRQQQPEKQPEREATRHEHQFNPVKPMPTLGMSGVTYVNCRAVEVSQTNVQPEKEVSQVEREPAPSGRKARSLDDDPLWQEVNGLCG